MVERTLSQSRMAGIVAMLPLALACVPWGILTGALSIQAGLTPLQGQVMSALVFAGAAQLSALTMMGTTSSLLPIFGSTLVISSRHLLYSMTFRKHVDHLPSWQRSVVGFVLTDEMFAVSETDTRKNGEFCLTFALWSGFTFYVIWNISTAIGLLAADGMQNLDELGLEFAIVATFIAMTFDEIRRFAILMTVITSGLVAVLLQSWLPDAYIIVAALSGMLVGYTLDRSKAQGIK